jgi:hypothetical protein
MDDRRIEADGARGRAIVLGGFALVVGLLLIVLPLYPKASGGYGWAMSQYPPGVGTRQTIAFALSWFSPILVGLAVVLALTSGRSAKAAGGAFLALGATAGVAFVVELLLVWTDVGGWRSATQLALGAIAAGLLLAAGSAALRADPG